MKYYLNSPWRRLRRLRWGSLRSRVWNCTRTIMFKFYPKKKKNADFEKRGGHTHTHTQTVHYFIDSTGCSIWKRCKVKACFSATENHWAMVDISKVSILWVIWSQYKSDSRKSSSFMKLYSFSEMWPSCRILKNYHMNSVVHAKMYQK